MQAGFSQEGYIIDQDHFAAYPYRGMTSNINGCGWIAAYNLLRAQGYDIDYETVHRDMNAMFPHQIPGPTPVSKLREYLARHGEYAFTVGKKSSLRACMKAKAGILRYWEVNIPHFITFVRVDGQRYRFFNVNDGLEDFTCTMEEFFQNHCVKPFVRAITPV